MRQLSMHRKYALLACLLMAMTAVGCRPFFDDLSKCSETTLEYRYIRAQEDEYSTEVQQMRHFLFNTAGEYIRELKQNEVTPQELRISGLTPGSYTVVTVGNSTPEGTMLTELEAGKSHMSDFTLRLKARYNEQAYSGAEQLFWNSKTFEVKEAEKQRYICDLANIHCHLFYEVTWQSAPPEAGKYRIELTGLTEQYSLDPAQSNLSIEVNPRKEVVHQFPLHADGITKLCQDVTLFNHTLEGEIISLRYRNDRIPTFQVMYGNKAITKKMDLSQAFKAFGWIPDRRAEQIYRLQLRINDDGSVGVRPWIEGTVEDWQPGGVILR